MNVQEILTTKEARFNLLAGLIRLAKCDEIVADSEWLFYQHAANSFELEPMHIERLSAFWNSEEFINVKFETRKEKIFFFIQAIQLCWVDKEYADIEKIEIRKLADEMGLELQVIEAVEKWVYEGIVWNLKSKELMEL